MWDASASLGVIWEKLLRSDFLPLFYHFLCCDCNVGHYERDQNPVCLEIYVASILQYVVPLFPLFQSFIFHIVTL